MGKGAQSAVKTVVVGKNVVEVKNKFSFDDTDHEFHSHTSFVQFFPPQQLPTITDKNVPDLLPLDPPKFSLKDIKV